MCLEEVSLVDKSLHFLPIEVVPKTTYKLSFVMHPVLSVSNLPHLLSSERPLEITHRIE